MRDPPNGKGQPTTDPNWASDSLNLIRSTIDASFVGIVGFSQGANLAVALAAKLEAEKRPLRFVVAFCGSQFGWAAQLPELFAAPLATPALLVRGEKDTLCPAPLCEALAALFRAGAVATVAHTAGHRPLPSAPQENVALCRRVARFAEAAVAVGS